MRPTPFFVLSLAAALGCAAPRSRPVGAEPVEASRIERSDPEALLARHPAGEPFEVRIAAATTHEAFWQKQPCAYTEWIFGSREDGQLVSFTIAERKGDEVELSDGALTAAFALRQLRLHLAPTLERELTEDDEALPGELRQLVAEGQINYLAEYCLEPGRTYHALVREDRSNLPPASPGGEPEIRVHRVLVISDGPMDEGRPAEEVVPSQRGWSY